MEFYRFKLKKYRKATRHLTTFQHGCYRLLIDEYMDTREPLPDNDQALANICNCTIEEFTTLASSTLKAMFKQKGGVLFHDYCDDELDYQDKKSKFYSERAKKGAEARHNKTNDLVALSSKQLARVKSKDISISKDIDNPLTPTELDQAKNLWNELAGKLGLAKVQRLTETRKKHLGARLKDCGGLEGWMAALEKVSKSDGLKGGNERGWKIDFDFLITENSFIKLMEGKYDDWGKQQTRLERNIQSASEWVDGR